MENVVYKKVDREKFIIGELQKNILNEKELYFRSGINSLIEIFVSIVLGFLFYFLSTNAFTKSEKQDEQCETLPIWTRFLGIFYFSLSFLSFVNIIILLLIKYLNIKKFIEFRKVFNLLSIIYLALFHLFFTIIITIYFTKGESCNSIYKIFTLIWIILMFTIWALTFLCCSFNWIHSLISLFKS